MTLTYILRSINFDTIYVDVPDLLNYKAYNYQTLHSASPRCTDLAYTLTRWPWPIFCAPVTLIYFASTFDISSTIRPTTIKPCKVLLLNVLTWQIPWPGDLDLYFGCSDFDIIYINVPDLLKCKTSSHQTLHSASPRCTDSAGILTRWPWPIFCAPVPFTHFTSTFNISNCKAYNHQTLHSASPQCTVSAGTFTWWPWPIFCAPLTFTPFTSPFHMSSTVRPSTTKPYIALLLDVLTRQVPWPGDLDLYCALQWLTDFMLMFGISSNIRPTTTKPCIVLHLIALAWQVPWPGDLDLYLTHFTLMFDNSSTIRPTTTIPCIVLLLDVLN